jgi:hypothetical protein
MSQEKPELFTNQKQRVATEHDVNARWNFGKPGERFRCYLCGKKFIVGDLWRWVCTSGLGVINLMTCDSCDGPDVKERFVAANVELRERFWWAINRGD